MGQVMKFNIPLVNSSLVPREAIRRPREVTLSPPRKKTRKRVI